MTTARQTVDIEGYRIEPLSARQDLDGFSCGEHEVDRNISKCCDWHEAYSRRVFCGYLKDETEVSGFYCISIQAPESKNLGSSIFGLPIKTNYIPFVYLNYIGVKAGLQNNGIGTILLMNALSRSAYVIRNIGVFGVCLHALNDRAAGLYDRYGFREHGGRNKPFMILPAKSVLELIPPTAPTPTA